MLFACARVQAVLPGAGDDDATGPGMLELLLLEGGQLDDADAEAVVDGGLGGRAGGKPGVAVAAAAAAVPAGVAAAADCAEGALLHFSPSARAATLASAVSLAAAASSAAASASAAAKARDAPVSGRRTLVSQYADKVVELVVRRGPSSSSSSGLAAAARYDAALRAFVPGGEGAADTNTTAAAAAAAAAPAAAAAAALDLRRFASLPELTALVRLFGPCAAVALAQRLEAPVAEALAQLDDVLMATVAVLAGSSSSGGGGGVGSSSGGGGGGGGGGGHGDRGDDGDAPLVALQAAVVAFNSSSSTTTNTTTSSPSSLAAALPAGRLAAVAACLVRGGRADSVVASAKTLGRALAMRRLIGAALERAMQEEAPLVAAVARNLGVPAAAGGRCAPPRHVCDVFGLPRPWQEASSAVASCPPDPFLAALLVGQASSVSRFRRWCGLPFVLGVAFALVTSGGGVASSRVHDDDDDDDQEEDDDDDSSGSLAALSRVVKRGGDSVVVAPAKRPVVLDHGGQAVAAAATALGQATHAAADCALDAGARLLRPFGSADVAADFVAVFAAVAAATAARGPSINARDQAPLAAARVWSARARPNTSC